MGAVVVRDDIYETITQQAPAGAIELFHGYTYSAHPAACAAGLAALDIYEREHLFERAAEMSDGFLDRIFSLANIPVVTDIRGYGMLAGLDLAPAEAPGARGLDALKRLYDAGLLIKLTGDTVIIAPPLVVSETDLDQMGDILRDVLMRL